jgi:hypothetical protein
MDVAKEVAEQGAGDQAPVFAEDLVALWGSAGVVWPLVHVTRQPGK